jgi:excisionase family DNA binding protein
VQSERRGNRGSTPFLRAPASIKRRVSTYGSTRYRVAAMLRTSQAKKVELGDRCSAEHSNTHSLRHDCHQPSLNVLPARDSGLMARFLSMKEASERLGGSPSPETLYRLGREGHLPIRRIGRRVVISELRLDEWAEGVGDVRDFIYAGVALRRDAAVCAAKSHPDADDGSLLHPPPLNALPSASAAARSFSGNACA